MIPRVEEFLDANDAVTSAKGAEYDSQGQARSASPLDKNVITAKALKERNTAVDISHFQCSLNFIPANQGRRASLRLALAPGYRIPRLRRCATEFRLLRQSRVRA